MADDHQPARPVAETATSRSLLMQLKDGQPAAWERLTSLYAPLVYHWCRTMRLAEQEMPDVFQQVFQSVASHIQTFHKDRPGDTFRHWLRAITRNKFMDRLNLSGNDPGRTGLQALLGSPHAIGLKELVLRNTGLVGQAMLEFGFARPELQLEVLNLGGNLLHAFGAENLATASCLRDLKMLTIDRCEINTAEPLDLAGATFLGNLRMLNVNHNSLGPEGLNALLELNPKWLHTLQMVNNDLGDEGATHLAESPASDTLVELDLSQNEIGEAGARFGTQPPKSKRVRLAIQLGLALLVAFALLPRPTRAEDKPVSVAYYYKIRWGFQQEFERLFFKNHYPILTSQKERIRDVQVYKPT
jgi:hypothetical protein